MNVLESASREEILKFKIACKSEELTDKQIDYLFVNFELEAESEIEEILDILIKFRPAIHKKYSAQLSPLK